MHAYPTKYHDANGVVESTMFNDGRTLKIRLRGITFQGSDFDALEPIDADSCDLSPFTLFHGNLCACSFELDMSVRIVAATTQRGALLRARIELGKPRSDPRGGLDHESVQLELHYDGRIVPSPGTSGWFEDELIGLEKAMSPIKMMNCMTCAFSDYSPYGHGCFGGLACFRDNKVQYRSVGSKDDLLKIWDTMTEFVQETHLCPEHEFRRLGTGYRG